MWMLTFQRWHAIEAKSQNWWASDSDEGTDEFAFNEHLNMHYVQGFCTVCHPDGWVVVFFYVLFFSPSSTYCAQVQSWPFVLSCCFQVPAVSFPTHVQNFTTCHLQDDVRASWRGKGGSFVGLTPSVGSGASNMNRLWNLVNPGPF